jgi:hypothetical protein
MKKRAFLHAVGIGTAAFIAAPAQSQSEKPGTAGPALLTVTGDITRFNRGALDPALDQLMAKQKVAFDRAYTFTYEALAALPQVKIRPVIEYDEKPHTLSGPLLADIVRSAGGEVNDKTSVLLRAIDGYAVTVSASDFHKYRFMAATHLDGKAMPLGGLGPLWAVYDADRFPELAAKPVAQRFGLCPWALYHVSLFQA